MAAKSSHHGDVRLWIEDVINSCTSIEHCDSTTKLIQLFEVRLRKSTDMSFMYMLGILDLKTRLGRKIIQIKANEKQSI